MVRVLVTGGAGFIGSHVVDELAGLGHEVVSLDVLHPGAHDGPPPYLRDDVTNLREDVRDREAVAGMGGQGRHGKPNAWLHCGTCSGFHRERATAVEVMDCGSSPQ